MQNYIDKDGHLSFFENDVAFTIEVTEEMKAKCYDAAADEMLDEDKESLTPIKEQTPTLTECIRLFQTPEILSPENTWYVNSIVLKLLKFYVLPISCMTKNNLIFSMLGIVRRARNINRQ
jgi:hypothetical protein